MYTKYIQQRSSISDQREEAPKPANLGKRRLPERQAQASSKLSVVSWTFTVIIPTSHFFHQVLKPQLFIECQYSCCSMERLKPSPLDTASADGPLVELTLQSISGLTYHMQTEEQMSPRATGDVQQAPSASRIPNVTAAVAFSGSANDMQVGSSCLCARTGNILVESKAAYRPPSLGREVPGKCSLVAEWHGNEGASPSPLQSFSSTSSSSQSQPHLTIRLPKRDPKLPSVPLSRMNRDCNVVYNESYPSSLEPPSLDESDVSSHTQGNQVAANHSKSFDDASDSRGASIVWSASGAGMPEIIELHVSLMVDAHDLVQEGASKGSTKKWNMQQTTYEVGLAYLVFFGCDAGTTVLELPIKKHLAQHTLSAQINPGVTLDDDAFLRVAVNVTDGKPAPLSPEIKYAQSQIVNMQTLEAILQQLRIAQDDHQRELRRIRLQQHEQGEEKQEVKHKKVQTSGIFCAGDMNGLLDMFKSLSGVVKHCDDGSGALYRSESMSSTIVTSASLGI